MNEKLLFLVKALEDALQSNCVCQVCLAGILDDFLHKAEERIEQQTVAHPSLAQAH